MRKKLPLLILLVVLVLCAIWSPWNQINVSFLSFLGIRPPESIGGLVVTSLAGDVDIFIDDTQVDSVNPATSPAQIPKVTPGERLIRLRRKSTVDNAYWQFEKVINFESGVDVVVAYELGPTQEFSEGHIIYATKQSEKPTKLTLSVISGNPGADVMLDNAKVGETPLNGQELDLSMQHTIKITKDGYESQEFKLLPEAQSDRDKLKGFELNVYIDMFLQPIKT